MKGSSVMKWFVYIVRCSDGSLYTGATNDVAARLKRHNAGTGARYTRSRLPVALVWKRRQKDKSSALSKEARLKRASRAAKLQLIAGTIPLRILLSS